MLPSAQRSTSQSVGPSRTGRYGVSSHGSPFCMSLSPRLSFDPGLASLAAALESVTYLNAVLYWKRSLAAKPMSDLLYERAPDGIATLTLTGPTR